VAASRRNTRSSSPELYEVDEMQVELAKFYAKIDELFPDDTIRHIDANCGVDEVTAAIWSEVMALRGESV
jgi:thymidylate kinase